MSSVSGCVSKFSADDDSLLIDLVSDYNILWKLSHPDFKNNMKKEKIWNGIGQKLNKTGESCKKRWKSIRDHFMREKKDISGTGKAAKRKKRATYWENLSFLNNVEDERLSVTNVGEEIKKADVETGNCAMGDKPDYTDDTEFNIEDDPTVDTAIEDLQSEEVGDEDGENVFIGPRSSTPQTKNMSTNSRAMKKDNKNYLVLNFLQQRQADKNKLVDCVEKIFVQEGKAPDNENDLFFKSMAAIVNKFDKRNQAIARNKVFSIISDLELSQYSTPSTPTASNSQGYGWPNVSPAYMENSSS